MYLIAPRIWIDSGISPIRNAYADLGYFSQFGTLYINRINMGIGAATLRQTFDAYGGTWPGNVETDSFFGGYMLNEVVSDAGLPATINRTTTLTKATIEKQYGIAGTTLEAIANETLSIGTNTTRIDYGYFTNLTVDSADIRYLLGRSMSVMFAEFTSYALSFGGFGVDANNLLKWKVYDIEINTLLGTATYQDATMMGTSITVDTIRGMNVLVRNPSSDIWLQAPVALPSTYSIMPDYDAANNQLRFMEVGFQLKKSDLQVRVIIYYV
jgi:hypothetical protein